MQSVEEGQQPDPLKWSASQLTVICII